MEEIVVLCKIRARTLVSRDSGAHWLDIVTIERLEAFLFLLVSLVLPRLIGIY